MSDLHAQIMNLQCSPDESAGINHVIAFRMGHKQARHDADKVKAAISATSEDVAAWQEMRCAHCCTAPTHKEECEMNARQRRKSMRVYFQHLKHLPFIFDHIADQIMMGGDLRKLELECREVAENIRAEKWDGLK